MADYESDIYLSDLEEEENINLERFREELDRERKAKEEATKEIEVASNILVSGIEKITLKVKKNFTSSGDENEKLLEFRKYSGISDLAYGVIRRTNEIVDQFLKPRDDEIAVGDLENIVSESQLDITELQNSVVELRAESSRLKAHVDAQGKELDQRKRHIEELEEKERMANRNAEGLMMDITAAEEEITRWKVAAEQEASACRVVEQYFISRLSALGKELDEAKGAMLESDKKLKWKEDTATAALDLRDAAEKSLRLADLRNSNLRERLEDLSQQLESVTQKDLQNQNRQRYACWSWQWLGPSFVEYYQSKTQQQNSNEKGLSEPLI